MSDGAASPKLPGIEPEHTWLAELVRVTAFSVPGTPLASKGWKEVFGAEPDQVIRQPLLPHHESGPVDGARWIISRQPDRIDVAVVPESPTSLPTDLPNVGDFQVLIDPLLARFEQVFEPNAAIQRLAVGVISFTSVETMRDGIRVLQSVVPQLHRIPENATDILFQINVPVAAKDMDQDLSINRLLKWQIANIQVLGFGFAPAAGVAVQVPSTVKRTVVRMELDINTVAERQTPLPKDKLGVLIRQLAMIAKDLSKNGGFTT